MEKRDDNQEKKFRTCCKCLGVIDLNEDKYVLLGTYNNFIEPKKEECFYHFNCFVDFWNDAVYRKMKIILEDARDRLMIILNNPEIKEALSQIQGSNQLLSMLQLNLQQEKTEEENVKLKNEEKKNEKKRKNKK